MNRPLIGDGLLLVAFHTFPQEKTLRFKQDMMVAFHALSLHPEYESFFRNYHFDTDGAVPFSPEIHEAWWEVWHSSGLLSLVDGQESDTAIFSKAVTLRFDHLKEELGEVGGQLAEQMSREMQSMLL